MVSDRVPEITYKCEHCGEEHTIMVREDYDGPILLTVCPKTGRGVVIENVE